MSLKYEPSSEPLWCVCVDRQSIVHSGVFQSSIGVCISMVSGAKARGVLSVGGVFLTGCRCIMCVCVSIVNQRLFQA